MRLDFCVVTTKTIHLQRRHDVLRVFLKLLQLKSVQIWYLESREMCVEIKSQTTAYNKQGQIKRTF